MIASREELIAEIKRKPLRLTPFAGNAANIPIRAEINLTTGEIVDRLRALRYIGEQGEPPRVDRAEEYSGIVEWDCTAEKLEYWLTRLQQCESEILNEETGNGSSSDTQTSREITPPAH